MFDSYKPGSDLTIMNTFYQYGIRNENGGRDPDYLIVNFKDNTTTQPAQIINTTNDKINKIVFPYD